ncbi:MAG: hypothetical protein ICV54_12680 [Nostoc sp. C3-bin3]|nr:hypothetical protein [Nostoc sp. C3-bin3]
MNFHQVCANWNIDCKGLYFDCHIRLTSKKGDRLQYIGYEAYKSMFWLILLSTQLKHNNYQNNCYSNPK